MRKRGAGKAHTRVPNLVYDIVIWLVEPIERDCLLYIVRHTFGYVDPTDPESGRRKARDMISLEQFEKGVMTGDYLRDLGIGRSKNTIKKALDGLKEKGLVDARFTCKNCRWEQKPGQFDPKTDPRTKAAACPRCASSLSHSYALVDLTSRMLVDLLNKYDKQGRRFGWDKKSGRARVIDGAIQKAEQQQKEDFEAEAKRLRDLLWYPEMVDKAIELAARKTKTGKISPKRKVNGFYKPVWEMQERFSNPPLIKYALDQTLTGPVFKGPKTQNWHRYMLKVAESNGWRFRRAGDPGEDDTTLDASEILQKRELSMRELLRRAADLNGKGETTEARALLSDILSQVNDLAELFDGDADLCETKLRLAFKLGSDDFVGVRPRPYSMVDYYPEWDAPSPIPLPVAP